MLIRRSSRSATAPASGPSTRAGSSEDSQTPPTALYWAAAPGPASVDASDARATRLSQSPRLDSDVAIHSRRNGLMDRTLLRRSREGDRKFTGSGYPHQRGSRGLQAREMSGRCGLPGVTWAPAAPPLGPAGLLRGGLLRGRLLGRRLLRRGPAP